MAGDFVQVRGDGFVRGGREFLIRGWSLGTWLNLEHFMIGLPGVDSQIRSAITAAYGPRNAGRFWSAFGGAMFSDADASYMADCGATTVRIPFNYRLFERDDAPGSYDAHAFDELDRAIDLCARRGLTVILDLHTVPGGQNPDWHGDNSVGECLFWDHPEFAQRVKALWRHIAAHYRGNTAVAGYDLMNEPAFYALNGKPVAKFYTELVAAVREVDREHVLFVEGDFYAHDFSAFEPFADPNVALSFHFYPFFGLDSWKESSTRDALAAQLEREIALADVRRRLKRPLWCGETGVPCNRGHLAVHERLHDSTLGMFNSEGIGWSVWTYKDARGMGSLRAAQDSGWMKLSESLCRGWDFWTEFFSVGAEIDLLEKRLGPMSAQLKRRLNFRRLADTQYALAERYPAVLEALPFDQLMAAVESLAFGRCERWEAVASGTERRCRG